ncbi:uncharacterized protein LOC119688816 [Teleopsis dalmanni]|uniref:uncharacterized protein LOC119688227 n=1 Tax=Teleopsis dalmanni TaxID=139649 RepID=UPI0018CC947A|nr:uncharacterized protein LOC119688227 [Teleopsis dalmanni]XP_037959409.1 uncharacterized protein LOC119688816 [Teleopsis dalmanni]
MEYQKAFLLKLFKIFTILLCFATTNADHQQQRFRTNTATTTSTTSTASTHTSGWLGPELTIVRRVYDDCLDKTDFIACLKQKALQALSRALEQDTIKIVDGLVLERQNHTETQSIIDAIADGRTFQRLQSLDRALLTQADKLVRTHALKIDMSVGRQEKGKKGKKGGGHVKYVIAALLTAMGIAGPIGLKALAAIAGKALVISKVALTIAGIIALKKLFSHDHHEETSFQVHAGDHNRRSTYVIRPMNKASSVPAAAASASVDPYRYYYEYH